MSSERLPKVFISYSHDSPEHEDRVLDLAERLVEQDGIDVSLDRFVNPPPASWPKWMNAEMKAADFILVVCSATYLAKVESKVKPGEGKGVKWESLLSYQQIYDNDSDSSRFIPVLLEGGKYEHIPDPMRGGSHYRPEDDAEYEKLIRHITNQPETPKPKPGPLRKLPPKERQAAKSTATKAAQAPAVSTLWNVPHSRNGAFTGREQILTDLRADLLKKGKQALFGLGGVGKTQIAVEYAYRHRDEYTAVFWSFAGTEQSVRGGFGAIAALLDLPEKESQEQAKVTDAVKNWLEENAGWLLVLDNADDPAMLKPFLPQQGKGHILLTSRAYSFHKIGLVSPREVNVLSPGEAREFLLRRTGKEPTEKSPEADALAKELGYLPLALEQAAAYIAETGASFSNYLEGYRKQGLKLLEKQGPVMGNDEKEQQKRTVATTWAINFDSVENNSPAAAELLRLSAFLAPDQIPLELLEKTAKVLPENLAAAVVQAEDNPLAVDELLSPLLRYSLVRRNDETQSYSIHPLVQEVIREGLKEDEQKAWAQRSVLAVNVAFPTPGKFENWPICERFLPHALACAEFIRSSHLEFAEAARLLNVTAFYLVDRAEYTHAESLYRMALGIREKVGPEHPTTGTILNNLAELYRHQSRYKEAEPLYRRALAIDEKTLGSQHLDVAVDLNNLALLLTSQRQYNEAEPLYWRASEIIKTELGPEHPTNANYLNNLALLYHLQSQYAKAEPFYREALKICEATLGPEHPTTAQSLNNMAQLYRDQGQPQDAEPLFQRALAICQRTLIAEHPTMAQISNSLAALYCEQNRYLEAEPLFKQAQAIFEKVLGLEHPETIGCRNNLILFYREQGRNAEADALEKRPQEKKQ